MIKSFFRILLLAAVSVVPAWASAQTDASTFGAKLGFTSKNTSAAFGLFYQYRINENLRLAPEVGCVFRHQDLDAFTMDVNVHFPLDFGYKDFCLYPLAGLDYSSWSRHDKGLSTGADKDVTTRNSRFGVNLGAGFEYYATETIKLNLECKYTLTSKYSTSVTSIGVGYMF